MLQCQTVLSQLSPLEVRALQDQILAPSRAVSSTKCDQPLKGSTHLQWWEIKLVWLQVLLKLPFRCSTWKNNLFHGVFSGGGLDIKYLVRAGSQ